MRVYPLKSEPKANTLSMDGPVWVGIDAHKHALFFTALDAERRILDRGQVGTSAREVEAFVRRFAGRPVTAVYEAGPTGYALLKQLKKAGWDAYMTAPSLIPVASGDRVKTDKRDSMKLATAARMGELTRVTERTEQDYADRSLMRMRDQAVAARSKMIRELKSLLLFHGLKVDASRGFTALMRKEVEEHITRVHPSLGAALRLHLKRLQDAHELVLMAEKECRSLDASTPYAKQRALLLTVPGIAEYSANRLCTELGDIRERFKTPEALGAYLGMTPSEHTTGGRQRRGHITRQGNSQARTTLVEASWTLVRKDPVAKARFTRLKERRGAKVAIVAMARKLAHSIWAMMRDGKPYGGEDTAAAPPPAPAPRGHKRRATAPTKAPAAPRTTNPRRTKAA